MKSYDLMIGVMLGFVPFGVISLLPVKLNALFWINYTEYIWIYSFGIASIGFVLMYFVSKRFFKEQKSAGESK